MARTLIYDHHHFYPKKRTPHQRSEPLTKEKMPANLPDNKPRNSPNHTKKHPHTHKRKNNFNGNSQENINCIVCCLCKEVVSRENSLAIKAGSSIRRCYECNRLQSRIAHAISKRSFEDQATWKGQSAESKVIFYRNGHSLVGEHLKVALHESLSKDTAESEKKPNSQPKKPKPNPIRITVIIARQPTIAVIISLKR